MEFQTEIRVLPPEEIDRSGLAKLTGVETPVAGVLEQTIFHVNQVMQFGKLLAVLQEHPSDPNRTIATVFMVRLCVGLTPRSPESSSSLARRRPLCSSIPGSPFLGGTSPIRTVPCVCETKTWLTRSNSRVERGPTSPRSNKIALRP